MFPRYIKERVLTSLQDTPVVLVNGPRQSGKTTFVKALKQQWSYLTFDDASYIEAARYDPIGFVNRLSKNVILDEVQHVPDLFRAIKLSVDSNRKPGRFLMTGSANILMLPKLSESLAGRIEAIALYPLSQSEIGETRHNFIQNLLDDNLKNPKNGKMGEELIKRVARGGYPEAVSRAKESRRFSWYNQYINTLIQRDVKELSQLDNLDQLPKLLTALANHSGQLLNKVQLSTIMGVSRTTINRFVKLLESIFLIKEIEPWSTNRNSRLIKTAKIHLIDTGLLCALLKTGEKELNCDRSLLGHILETFVYNELLKQASWLNEAISFFHYRDNDQKEVDIVLETGTKLIGIEVKAAESVQKRDFSGLETLRHRASKKFKIGIVFYDGTRIIPFGPELLAVPVSALWS